MIYNKNIIIIVLRPLVLIIINLLIFINQSYSALDFQVKKISKEERKYIGGGDTVYISGEIAQGDNKRFAAFLKKNKVLNESKFYLSSVGGNLIEATNIGRTLREWQAITFVRSKNNRENICLSACVFMFMGGKFRFFSEDQEKIGVHQFYAQEKSIASGDTQKIYSYLVRYVKEMGVDVELLGYASLAQPKEMILLDKDTSKRLNLTNNGIADVNWKYNDIDGNGLYLKGERSTIFGMQKVMLMCGKEAPLLQIMFEAKKREKELRKSPYIILEAGDFYSVNPVETKRLIMNGYMIAFIPLAKKELKTFLSNEAINIRFMEKVNDYKFLGIADFPISQDGHKRISSFLNISCRS